MKILFLCSHSRSRSLTAEEIFQDRHETRSLALYPEAEITEDQLQWPELIIVMEDEQRKEIAKRFPGVYRRKRIISLEIPDLYQEHQPELVKQLEKAMATATLEESQLQAPLHSSTSA